MNSELQYKETFQSLSDKIAAVDAALSTDDHTNWLMSCEMLGRCSQLYNWINYQESLAYITESEAVTLRNNLTDSVNIHRLRQGGNDD